MDWNVYLSGEIHTDWRQQIKDGCEARDLPITFSSAVTDHQASDAAGDLLGEEDKNYWRDHKSANPYWSKRIKQQLMKGSYV